MADSYNELFGLGSHSEDANLEGWWLLQDDAASTAVDDQSSNARDGTLTGGDNTSDISNTGPNSYLAKSLDFDGTADYVDIGAVGIGTSSDLTLLCWAYADVLSGIQYLMGVQDGGNDGSKAMRFNGTDLEGFTIGNNTKIATAAFTDTMTWKHCGMRFDHGTDLTMYVNGSGGTSTSCVGQTITAELTNFKLARRPDGSSLFLNGRIAGAAIFTRLLTTAECDEHRLGAELVNSVAPVVSGPETEGQTLSVTTGTWALPAPFASGSNGTATYSYQWTRSDNGSGLNEADISGATSSTYTLVAADVGKYIRSRVRASNDGGFDSAADTNSNFTGAIAASSGTVGTGLTRSILLQRASLVG